MKLTQSSASFNEPVSLAELRAHLRIEHNDEDSYLSMLIGAARATAETVIDGIIADRQFSMVIDDFESVIELPLRPVDTSTIAISYLDTEGAGQTFTDFDYTTDLFKTKIYPAYNASWPEVEQGRDKVTVTFTAGLAGVEGSMPLDVKHAILMIASTLYDQREDHTAQVKLNTVPTSSQLLLDGYKRVIL